MCDRLLYALATFVCIFLLIQYNFSVVTKINNDTIILFFFFFFLLLFMSLFIKLSLSLVSFIYQYFCFIYIFADDFDDVVLDVSSSNFLFFENGCCTDKVQHVFDDNNDNSFSFPNFFTVFMLLISLVSWS